MNTAPTRLLLIDDDPEFQHLVTAQLSDSGIALDIATSAEEGLAASRARRPDVVLCDWSLPGRDGLSFCREIKADTELRSIYVALLSGRGEVNDRIAGLDAGADDYLVKPVPQAELLARIRAGLRSRDLQRDLLEQQQRLSVEALAATLGHEINNPLTALFGHLELILVYLERGDTQRLQHHLKQAGEVGSRIADVAQRLISLRDPQTKPYLDDTQMVDL